MPFLEINLPPGIMKNATEYSNKGNWTDGNLVRWVNGKMNPVGGWVKVQAIPITADVPIREMFSWVDNKLQPWTLLGAADKLFAYVIDSTQPTGDRIIDVTPTDLSILPTPGFGYGSETYGTGRYGIRDRPPAAFAAGALWDFDNFGEDCYCVQNEDGRLFRFQPSLQTNFDIPVPAAVVPNAPVDNVGVLITQERHVMVFGAGGDPRKIEWSSQEDPDDWLPTATNTAGGIGVQTTGAIIGAVHVRGGILVITSTSAHLMRYLGPPFIYSIEHIGDNCGAFGQQTIVGAYDQAFWMGHDRFWMYDGAVKRLPCTVLEYVFQNINRGSPFSFNSGANSTFNEIWFFYPTAGSTEADRYVVYSYRDQPHWTIGNLERTAFHDNQVYSRPLAVSVDGTLYFHEFGFLDDGNPRGNVIFAESAPYDIAKGERTTRIRKLFQDAFDPTEPTGNIDYPYSISLKMRPAADGGTRLAGPFTINSARGYTDVRAHGRSAQIVVNNEQDRFWELGTLRFDVTPGGRRGF